MASGREVRQNCLPIRVPLPSGVKDYIIRRIEKPSIVGKSVAVETARSGERRSTMKIDPKTAHTSLLTQCSG